MDKTLYSKRQELVMQMLVSLRREAGLNQRQLADKLGRERSLIARLELGQRRVDLAEFFTFCKACGADPVARAEELMRQFETAV